jgi:hypothetical protein
MSASSNEVQQGVWMPISVVCACGRKLKAPDQLAGQQAKCPQCGAVVAVPAMTAPAAGVTKPAAKAPAPAPPPKPKAPAARPAAQPAPPPPAGAGNEYDLDLNELMPASKSAPAAPVAINAAAPAASTRQCPACKAVMPAEAVMCEACGFSPRSGTYIDRTKRGRYAGDDGPQPWFTVAGIEFTPVRTAILGVFLLMLVGLAWWYATGPGANFRVREVKTVYQVTALGTLGVIPQGSLLQGTLFTANPSAGIKVPTGGLPPNVKGADLNTYGVGYDGKLLLTQEHQDGDWLLMRVDVRQSYMQSLKQVNRYDVSLAAPAFKLVVDGTPQDVMLIPNGLAGPLQVELGGSPAGDYKAMLPPLVPIDKSTGEEPRNGEVIYEGKNGVTGSVKYLAHYLTYRTQGSSGLTGNGKLEVKDSRGIEATLEYGGSDLKVSWNTGTLAWRTADGHTRTAAISPWHKHECWLITPRPPKSAKRIVLTYCDQEVKELSGRWAATKDVTASSVPQGPKGPPKKDLLDKAGEQLGGYVGALANARRRAQGTVSGSNIRQLFMALEMYAQRNNGRLPEKLEDLRMYLDGFDQLLFNPRTKENPGFIYVKPNADDVKNKPAGDIPIFYEALYGKIDPDGAVGYLDGSIEQGSAAPLKDPAPAGTTP